MLYEVPNNNKVIRIANIMLNEAPNSHDTTRIGNNALNCNGRTTILNGGYIAIIQKSRLTRDMR